LHRAAKLSTKDLPPLFKGTIFDELRQAAIHRIEQLLNHRPPDEVFRKARGALDG
jgi:hypothetical protein